MGLRTGPQGGMCGLQKACQGPFSTDVEGVTEEKHGARQGIAKWY